MKLLFILNGPPYGTEHSYNGLRLASNMAKTDPAANVSVFLMGDAVSCAKTGQQTPNGYYNLERMIKGAALLKVSISLCGTCMDARGLKDEDLIDGCTRGSLDALAAATFAADKVLVF